MLIGESFEQPHRKSTIQGRLEPISCSTTSPTTSVSKDTLNFDQSAFPFSRPLFARQTSDSPQDGKATSLRELKPLRLPQPPPPSQSDNLLVSPNDEDNDKTLRSSRSKSMLEFAQTASAVNRRYSIQVPSGGHTAPHKTAAPLTGREIFQPKRRDRVMSIDQRFDTCAQFVESVRKEMGNP